MAEGGPKQGTSPIFKLFAGNRYANQSGKNENEKNKHRNKSKSLFQLNFSMVFLSLIFFLSNIVHSFSIENDIRTNIRGRCIELPLQNSIYYQDEVGNGHDTCKRAKGVETKWRLQLSSRLRRGRNKNVYTEWRPGTHICGQHITGRPWVYCWKASTRSCRRIKRRGIYFPGTYERLPSTSFEQYEHV